jgi:adenylate kinase family enzyme
MIDNVSITTKTNKKHVMTVDSYSRWLCLMEALEHINGKAKESKINLERTDSWIKPLAIQKYIKQRFPSMNHDFKVEEYLD